MDTLPKHKVFFAVGTEATTLPRAVTIYEHYAPEDLFCLVVAEITRQEELTQSDGIYARALLVDGERIECENVNYNTFTDKGYHTIKMC